MRTNLHVLFVEDSQEDFEQISRQISEYFEQRNDLIVHLDGKQKFEDAIEAISNPHIRYDLIISDTYRGEHRNADAAVMNLVDNYRKNDKFCPIIVCSSGICPPHLESSPFVNWVGKERPEDLEIALTAILSLGIPQLARTLHDEIDSIAGDYLWGFLEKNWQLINKERTIESNSLNRLIRSRAAMLIGGTSSAINRHGLEYYMYPRIAKDYFSLGDIVRNKRDNSDIQVILTPHCLLYKQNGKESPKAEYVLLVKTVPASAILGEELTKMRKLEEETKKLKKLSQLARSPAQTGSTPEGRHWYLPHFLEVPHLFCDFLQVLSVEFKKLENDYDCIATLTPPYAEALQQSFASFYGSVGIPNIDPLSITSMLD